MYNEEYVMLSGELFSSLFPLGVPRSSFIVVCGDEGSGKSLFLVAMVKSLLLSGEPVLYVSVDDDPATVAHQFSSLGVNVLEFVKRGTFFIVDGFSYRVREEKRRRMHVSVIGHIEPQNIRMAIDLLLKILEENGFNGRGALVIDSLNEFLSYNTVDEVVEGVKDLRANVSKARAVLVIASLHTTTPQAKDLLQSISHFVDGVIYMERRVEGEKPVFRVFVRRLKGAVHNLKWVEFYLGEDKELRIARG